MALKMVLSEMKLKIIFLFAMQAEAKYGKVFNSKVSREFVAQCNLS